MNISGTVTKGEQIGRTLGFPTANLDRRSFSRRKLKIKLGIYGGSAELKTKNFTHSASLGQKVKIYSAAIVIGPLDKRGLPKIEAHLLNFQGNLYGKKLKINLNKYIRPFKKFKSEAELKRQIKKDIASIKISL